ncbi:MAG: hypothetical protein ACLP7Q_10895 [Isosphaeraceae bacterium]
MIPKEQADSIRLLARAEKAFPTAFRIARLLRVLIRTLAVKLDAWVAPDRWSRFAWLQLAVIAVLPLALSSIAYGIPKFSAVTIESLIHGDATCHAYLLTRNAELHGRWWLLGSDERAGSPYPTLLSSLPARYENVCLLTLSAMAGEGWHGATRYRVACMVVLVANAWVGAWLVWGATRSSLAAILSIVLLTLNVSLGGRIMGHLYLMIYAWALLTVWAYFQYLDEPSPRRGVILGVLMALTLQSSFYFGYFLTIGLTTLFTGGLIAGQIQRKHITTGLLAAATSALLAALLTFPVWTVGWRQAVAKGWVVRDPRELWMYGSEIVSYVWPPWSRPGWAHPVHYIAWARPGSGEGWNYPGIVVLGSICLFLIARLKYGCSFEPPAVVTRLLCLSGVLVTISLSGGPGLLLYRVVPFFRCYGRAGILAIAIWAVAIPILLAWFAGRWARPSARFLIMAGAIVLALWEGVNAGCWSRPTDSYHLSEKYPAWVSWLAKQPTQVRLAAFALIEPQKSGGESVNSAGWDNAPLYPGYFRLRGSENWSWEALFYVQTHRHATLNGADVEALDADLERYGATVSGNEMSEEALAFLHSLGYTHFAFDAEYMKKNTFLATSQSLSLEGETDGWSFLRFLPPGRAERK